jgi:hypothetical protein
MKNIENRSYEIKVDTNKIGTDLTYVVVEEVNPRAKLINQVITFICRYPPDFWENNLLQRVLNNFTFTGRSEQMILLGDYMEGQTNNNIWEAAYQSLMRMVCHLRYQWRQNILNEMDDLM